MPRSAKILLIAGGVLALVGFEIVRQLPSILAGALLHPSRQRVTLTPPSGCADAEFQGAGVRLTGWRCAAAGAPRGTLVYLHGIADNRTSGAGLISRFTTRGLDVIAYDSRAHGNSDGDICTYGFFEKQDLGAILDRVEHRPIILMGNSLGAAVALQAAAGNPGIAGVVAADTFSDLRTVARERAPFGLTDGVIQRAFLVAEERGHFTIDDASPARAAAAIDVPVLLIHGTADDATTPDHSERVFAALRGPKKRILVEGARHSQSLSDANAWREIEAWLANLLDHD